MFLWAFVGNRAILFDFKGSYCFILLAITWKCMTVIKHKFHIKLWICTQTEIAEKNQSTRVLVLQPGANVTNFTQIGVILQWKRCNFSSLGVTASGLSAHLIKCMFNYICVFSMHSVRWGFYYGSHFQKFQLNEGFRLCYMIWSNVICSLGISIITHVAADLNNILGELLLITWCSILRIANSTFRQPLVLSVVFLPLVRVL